MKIQRITPAIAVVMLLAATLTSSPAVAVTATKTGPESALDTFPVPHMSISYAPDAGGMERPGDTVWVGLDDGTAAGLKHEWAVPVSGTLELVDPATCDEQSLCVWSWVGTGTEVRAFTRWQGQSCVLIGSSQAGERTQLNCGGVVKSL